MNWAQLQKNLDSFFVLGNIYRLLTNSFNNL